MLHLEGPWGLGKSTLLRFLSADLKARDPSWLVVNFNAWRHQRAGAPWWLLMAALEREALSGRRAGLHSLRIGEKTVPPEVKAETGKPYLARLFRDSEVARVVRARGSTVSRSTARRSRSSSTARPRTGRSCTPS
ncbi:MAG: KAP family NTPase [Actinomycetota bacterium]|nr:KAP family NTPase [Actinomycetota bacterium]